jgi:hypothetical protein
MLYRVFFDGYAIVDAASEEDAVEKALFKSQYLMRETNEAETFAISEDEAEWLLTS